MDYSLKVDEPSMTGENKDKYLFGGIDQQLTQGKVGNPKTLLHSKLFLNMRGEDLFGEDYCFMQIRILSHVCLMSQLINYSTVS